MYLLTKKSVIFGMMDVPNYVRLQSNGYYVPCSFTSATHILFEEQYYSALEYRLILVENIPEGMVFDGTWVLEEGEILQSGTLKQEKEATLFLESLPDKAMLELSARLEAVEEELENLKTGEKEG